MENISIDDLNKMVDNYLNSGNVIEYNRITDIIDKKTNYLDNIEKIIKENECIEIDYNDAIKNLDIIDDKNEKEDIMTMVDRYLLLRNSLYTIRLKNNSMDIRYIKD